MNNEPHEMLTRINLMFAKMPTWKGSAVTWRTLTDIEKNTLLEFTYLLAENLVGTSKHIVEDVAWVENRFNEECAGNSVLPVELHKVIEELIFEFAEYLGLEQCSDCHVWMYAYTLSAFGRCEECLPIPEEDE